MSIKAGNGSVGGNYLSQTYLSGSIILSQSYTESFSDGISAIDSITRNPFKVFADNIGLTDLIRRLTGKNVFSDNIGASDNISFTKVLILILTDTINMIDDFFTDYFQFFSRLFTDGIGMADSWSRKLDKLLSFSDGITLSEVVKKGLNRILTDIISAIDNIHFTQHFLRTFTDTISAIDNIGKKTITAFSDAIGLVDSKILTPIKVFVESISLSENIVKSVKIVLSSTIHIRDSIVRRLNGMLISWEKTAMDIADWTKTNKKEDTFSKTARNEEEWTKLKGEK